MATVIEGLLKKLKAAEEAGNTGKATLIKKAIKRERAKKANANAENLKKVEKDQDARRAASKGGSGTSGQSGAGRSIFDIIRKRNADVDNDTKKAGG